LESPTKLDDESHNNNNNNNNQLQQQLQQQQQQQQRNAWSTLFDLLGQYSVVCSTCAQEFHSIWALVDHVQS
ncbi:MAG: hypothetical protein N6V41_01610, partial [Candidatus Portiera aleyrodidarum]|nr:hypothetical protein [Candidatus Portiera aleyrodidarum]